MGKFYVLKTSYEPNTAGSNRLMGMLKYLSKKGIDTEVVFFMSDKNNNEAPTLPHISYKYYWKKFNVKNNKVKNILYLYLYSKMFIKTLNPGDTVYLYGCSEMIADLVKVKNVRIFHERTEHPLVSKLRFLNVKKYLKACTKLNGLFVISTSLRDYYCEMGVSQEKIHIINMTVDSARFTGLSKNNNERFIAYCGKATNNKDGVDRLIKAFAITSDFHPDIKLYIIGTPPKKSDISGNYELVEDLNLTKKVKFTGVIPSEEIPQILKNAEILALARPDNKQAKYGFPTKLGEYLLTGNPVVITDVGDISLFLKDNDNALIANPDSIKDFSDKLNWALENPQKAFEIGEAGKKIALEYFNSEIESQKMIDIIFKTDII